ncbi:ATP phosphoribosyltransferase regulatory subunit [Motiliproteus sp. MSK22-1]|uniref:ATP phosphoribosyltransferase regulatory subunit n=1 Tax=Motiliproteus sp. MSK22-1 TaxID=1897630 RepID=UPI000976E7D0|nr:ATP phosphoribosyltransferase regulatory subunit [Motiliproteus sp. MSK22-1]OMH31822.1 ATP phosphoribosyltransferase regulatory subunit [Motiliproteus sp. MSK22-1]
MSIADRWLLPDGVKEILPPEARKVEQLRRRLLDLFHSWGYDLVMPPLIEYLDSLLTGTGNDLALSTYKITDQLTGRLMGLRADTTPQVARIDAHSLPRETTARYCYVNSVLHTVPENMLAGRSPMQIGAELYGHCGVESDIEVICLMLETLKAAGVTSTITLDLGHVAFYRALIEEAKLTAEDEAQLFELLQGKAITELEVLLDSLELSSERTEQFRQLIHLSGDCLVLDRATELLGGLSPATDAALQDLKRIADMVSACYPQVQLYFDLSELRGYNYHTGVVFAAYVPEYGQALIKGGRYDQIGKDFGRARPATGFSGDLKVFAEVTGLAGVTEGAVFAPAEEDVELHRKVAELRKAGMRVVCSLPGEEAGAAAMNCDKQLVRGAGGWELSDV